MKYSLLFFLMFFYLLAKAQNIEVSGYQSGTWDADTVFVVGDVFVSDTLRIAPGTCVSFTDYYNINIRKNASLMALGEENDSIVFTVADTTGFFKYNSGRGGWNGITMYRSGAVRFEYCRLQYGKAALDDDQDGGALRIYECEDVAITNSTLRNNFSREHGGALNAINSIVTMQGCEVLENKTYTGLDTVYFMYGGGLRFLKCDVHLTDMVFRNNNGKMSIGGALCLDSCAVVLNRAEFEGNHGLNGAGLYLIRSNDYPCIFSNLLFHHNLSDHFAGGMAISDASPEIINVTVADNHSIGVNCAGVFLYQHASPVFRNCIIYGNRCPLGPQMDEQLWIWSYDDWSIIMENCLLDGGLEGVTNNQLIHVVDTLLSCDPCFVDPEGYDYHLSADSPCVDAGSLETPQGILDGVDLDGMPRLFNDRIDMGPYECFWTDLTEDLDKKNNLKVVGNPLSSISYVELTLQQKSKVMTRVYSASGTLVWTKDCGIYPPGTLHVDLGGLLEKTKSGLYVIEVTTSEGVFTSKVVRIR